MGLKYGKVGLSKDHETQFNTKKHTDDYDTVSKYLLKHIQK